MKNELYVVKDIPQYSEDVSNYCYVVKATSYDEAIEIVKNKTGHNWEWDVELADNDEVWQWFFNIYVGANIGTALIGVNEFKSRKSVIRLTKVRMGSSPITHVIYDRGDTKC